MNKNFMNKNNKISKQLIYFGMNPKNDGFAYWVEVISSSQKLNKLKMEKIYFKLAKKYEKNRDAIERNMRYAKMVCVPKIQKEYNCNEKITNKKFLELFLQGGKNVRPISRKNS